MIASTLPNPERETPETGQRTAVQTAKVVVVYGMNYAPEIAGVGKYTGEIAEYFASEGMNVTVVTTPPHYPGWKIQPGYRNRYSSAYENRVHVMRTPLILRQRMKGIWRLIAPLSFAISSAPVVFWQIIRLRPDTVFCVEPTLFAAPIAQLAAKLVGARLVLHVQDLEVDAAFAVGHLGSKPSIKRIGFMFERAVLRNFDQLVTISNRMAEKLSLKGIPNEKISVVRNWVDLSQIFPQEAVSPYRAELGFTDDNFVVLYSGNIGAKQGLDTLLDAAEKLREKRHIKFVIAGEGPMKFELQSRYSHLENLMFLPFQPYTRLNAFMNMANLHCLTQSKGAADLVLPSKLGGMLASGKSIIVTADKGTELVEFLGNAAIITPPGDSAGLAEGIVSALHCETVRAAEHRILLANQLSRVDGLDAFKKTIS